MKFDFFWVALVLTIEQRQKKERMPARAVGRRREERCGREKRVGGRV